MAKKLTASNPQSLAFFKFASQVLFSPITQFFLIETGSDLETKDEVSAVLRRSTNHR